RAPASSLASAHPFPAVADLVGLLDDPETEAHLPLTAPCLHRRCLLRWCLLRRCLLRSSCARASGAFPGQEFDEPRTIVFGLFGGYVSGDVIVSGRCPTRAPRLVDALG